MAELTSRGIELFFRKLGSTSAASLLYHADEIPATQSKLDKVSRETWAAWGMA